MFLLLFGIADGSRRPFTFDFGIAAEGAPIDSLVDALSSTRLVEVRRVAADEGRQQLREGRLAALLIGGQAGWADAMPFRLLVDDRWSALATTVLDGARVRMARHETAASVPIGYRIERQAARQTTPFAFIFPGLIAMALLQLGLFATAAPLLRSRERGTLRHLSTTPASRLLVALSQIAPRFLIAGLQVGLLLGLGVYVFDVRVASGLAALCVASALGTLMLVAIGYALAGVAPSLESGLLLVMLTNFTMLALGQVLFDLGAVGHLRLLVLMVPLTHLSDMLRQIITGSAGLLPVWLDALLVAAWTMLAVFVATHSFRFDMEER